jgi:hypothetical protein
MEEFDLDELKLKMQRGDKYKIAKRLKIKHQSVYMAFTAGNVPAEYIKAALDIIKERKQLYEELNNQIKKI